MQFFIGFKALVMGFNSVAGCNDVFKKAVVKFLYSLNAVFITF
jgi:hypothetical protein